MIKRNQYMSKEISSNWYSWLKGQYKFIYTTNRFNSSTKTAITEIHLAECICYDWLEKWIQTFTAGLDEKFFWKITSVEEEPSSLPL